jgi:hypothetical protein
MMRSGLFWLLAFMSAGCFLLRSKCEGQTLSWVFSGTPNTYVLIRLTANPVLSGLGTSSVSFQFPAVYYSYQGSFPTPTKANDGLATIGSAVEAGTPTITFGGSPAHVTSVFGGNGSNFIGFTLDPTGSATFNASGGTVALASSRVIYNGSTLSTGGSGGPFTFVFNASGSLTSGPSIGISQRTLTWTVTNGSGSLGEWAIFQFNTSAFTSPTGAGMQLTWIEPGGSHTFQLTVAASDPFFYAPAQINLAVSQANGEQVSGAAGNLAGINLVPITSGLSTGLLEGWASGTDLTALPTPGTTGGSTGADGGTTGGTSAGGAPGSNLGGSPGSSVATVPTPGTVTSSGSGTVGPGGSTSATDQGAANNAAAINSGIASAANAIDGTVAQTGQAIVKQIAAGEGTVSSGSNPNSEAVAAAELAQVAATPSLSSMQSAGAAEAASEGSVIHQDTSNVVSDSDTAPNLTVTLPSRFGGATIDFNPFESARFANIALWFKTAMEWLTLGLFASYCWKSFREMTMVFGNVQQARGNPVVGGTGAQATALLAAGAISVAVATALVALIGGVNSGVASLVATFWATNSPNGSLPSLVPGALWMVGQVLPYGVMLSAFVGRILWDEFSTKILVICMATVRFITP